MMMARGNGAHAWERDSDIKAKFVCFFCLGVNNDLKIEVDTKKRQRLSQKDTGTQISKFIL